MKATNQSLILNFKRLVYKYTGIFLAHKEELEYIRSDEFWKKFLKIINSKKNDMDSEAIQSLLIGSWQTHNGFTRPMSFIRYKKPQKFFRFVEWFVILYTVIKLDIKDIIYKVKNSNE
jgi:hypothetical protein